jgi:hypothetical protein
MREQILEYFQKNLNLAVILTLAGHTSYIIHHTSYIKNDYSTG